LSLLTAIERSLVATIERTAPKVAKPIRMLVIGNDPKTKVERMSISVMVLLLIGTAVFFASNGTGLFANGFGGPIISSATCSVKAVPDIVGKGDGLTLVAKISHFFRRVDVSVTLTVTGPPRSGIDGSKSVILRTDSDGDGRVKVHYPFRPPFVGTASTDKRGTYTVFATFVFIYTVCITATSFRVVPDRIYLTQSQTGTVAVLDENNNFLGTIKVGNNPSGIAFDSANDEVYVTNSGSGTVSVINDTSLQVMATIAVGSRPTGVVYDPNNTEIYVANAGSNTVSVINGNANDVTGTINVPSPNGLVYDSAADEIYVSQSAGSVTVISGGNNAILGTISVGASPSGMAFDQNNSEVYVADSGSNQLSIIDGATNSLLRNVALGAGSSPWGVTYDSSNSFVYITEPNTNSISVLDTTTNAAVAQIYVGPEPLGTAFFAPNNSVYVASGSSSNVFVLSPESAQVSVISLGSDPAAVGVN
jgi:YVTN family beta-propeller protein